MKKCYGFIYGDKDNNGNGILQRSKMKSRKVSKDIKELLCWQLLYIFILHCRKL